MTTIVYRDGVLAADRAMSDGGCFFAEVRKIERINGCFVGSCGSASNGQIFSEWFRRGCSDEGRPKIEGSFEALVVRPNGDVDWYGDSLSPIRLQGPWFTIGSGFRIATGALAMGASAVQAVEVACQFDDSTRGPVDVLRIEACLAVQQ